MIGPGRLADDRSGRSGWLKIAVCKAYMQMTDVCHFMHEWQQQVITSIYASAQGCNDQGFMHAYATIAWCSDVQG